jgi:serine protease Do
MLKVEAKDLVPVQWGESKSAAVGDLLASPGTGEEAVAVGVLSVAARAVKVRDLPPSTPPANSGFLGVGLDEAEGGARIVQIVANSAAFKAGLQENDIVTAIADTPIIDSETMVNTIQHHKPGDTVDIRLKRGQQELALKVTLQKRTPEQMQRRDYQNTLGSELSDRRGGFPQVLQHDMVLRPIDCGGPVVNLDGKAVGINIARAGRVESYAIPAEAVRGLIQDLQSGKLAPPKDAPPTTRPTTRPATTAPSK